MFCPTKPKTFQIKSRQLGSHFPFSMFCGQGRPLSHYSSSQMVMAGHPCRRSNGVDEAPKTRKSWQPWQCGAVKRAA